MGGDFERNIPNFFFKPFSHLLLCFTHYRMGIKALNNMYSIFFAFLTGIKIVMHPADKRGKLLGIRLPGFV